MVVREWDPTWKLVQPLDPARDAASSSLVDLDEFQSRIEAAIATNMVSAPEDDASEAETAPGAAGGGTPEARKQGSRTRKRSA